MLLFNEITVTLYVYALISISDFNECYELYDILGLVLLSIVIFAFVVNILSAFINIIFSIIRLFRFICSKCSNKKDRVIQLRPLD